MGEGLKGFCSLVGRIELGKLKARRTKAMRRSKLGFFCFVCLGLHGKQIPFYLITGLLCRKLADWW